MRFFVETDTAGDRDELFAALYEHGYLWHSDPEFKDYKAVEPRYSAFEWPFTVVTPYNRKLSGYARQPDQEIVYAWPADKEAVLRAALQPQVRLPGYVGNEGWLVTVSADGAQVGCTPVSREQFERMADIAALQRRLVRQGLRPQEHEPLRVGVRRVRVSAESVGAEGAYVPLVVLDNIIKTMNNLRGAQSSSGAS